MLVAEGLDRLSRDQEHTASLFKQLAFAGVRLVTVAEGEIGELHVGLKGTMNALFLRDLALKTHRGLRGRVEQGRSGGGRCYGYAVVPARLIGTECRNGACAALSLLRPRSRGGSSRSMLRASRPRRLPRR